MNKISRCSHTTPSQYIGRGVMGACYPCDIFISVKVSPLRVFKIQVWISEFQEDRKALAFDLRVLSSCVHKIYYVIQKMYYVQNSQSPITPTNYVKLQ